MPDTTATFQNASQEIERTSALRDAALLAGFKVLEQRNHSLAQMMLTAFGDRRRAALWMSQPQRALGGRTSWQVLIDGDEETLWDALEHRQGRSGTAQVTYADT
ncbi:antitoxin Xre/MbcA/ParS toxin-binding domain-containing protein [Pinirhizobacter sp.]|jgi:hypothetical protein|uniref:antitoxin Xre/MbcA/ParS toxin-binding domain-containing protein n=1 Tax=Pinirhizobacter sp. TaxID=2950432 RepID=UPI002F40F31F